MIGCPLINHTIRHIMVRDIEEVSLDLFKECPGPLENKTPRVTTIGTSPYLLAIKDEEALRQGKNVRKFVLEPGTGNPMGTDFDLTSLLCEKLKTNHFILRVVKDRSFDYYNEKTGWRGRGGEVKIGSL